MGINWIKIEDEMPKDNGKIQKFLVCINRRTSCFQNCEIVTCYFTDKFHTENLNLNSETKITHWAKIEKPEEFK